MADVRLIDANALIVEIAHRNALDVIPGADFEKIWLYSTVQLDMFNIVKAAPTIDAVPVVHGRWKWKGRFKACSECGTYIDWDNTLGASHWHYCPNCGTKMDGGTDNA